MPLNQTLRKNSNILWTISIIQDQNPQAQTKAEFAEMANDVLNTATINKITLCLADNLQRFRFMIEHGFTEEEAIQRCEKLSKTWHEDNSESLQKLTQSKNLSFITWQEFITWPHYDKTLQELEDWYKENRDFRIAVDGRVRQAREAISIDAKIDDPIEQAKLLKRYLLEECAYQKFGASKSFNYEIYKTQQSKAMRRVKNNNDFVPAGTMLEVHFTQFNTSEKKQKTIETHENHLVKNASFGPIFSHTSKKNHIKPVIEESSLLLRATEFIEKTLALVPLHQQEQAINALLKFTSQEIVPLCYKNKITLGNME